MASDVLRVGIVGAGLIAQAAHLPNTASNPRTELVALAEPSRIVRESLAARYSIPHAYETWQGMLEQEALDAIVVCSPHATHAAIVLAAIELGVHCLVEKPLCIDPADANLIDERAAQAGVLVQVGYMKRYDPGFDALICGLPQTPDRLLLVDVTTYDPWMSRPPFVDWDRFIRGTDIDPAALERFRADEARQVGAAVGADDPGTVRAYSYTFLACLVHDVNLVHGVLDRWGLVATPRGSHAWGQGAAASIWLDLDSGAQWRSTWMLLGDQEEFLEQARLYFADGIHELSFPVPYHAQVPTRYRASGRGPLGQSVASECTYICDTYRAELDAFIDCIVAGAQNRTPPGQGGRDIALLRDLFILGSGAKDLR